MSFEKVTFLEIPSNTDKKLTKIRIVTGAFENSALILGKLHMYRSYHSLTDYGQGLRFFCDRSLTFIKNRDILRFESLLIVPGL